MTDFERDELLQDIEAILRSMLADHPNHSRIVMHARKRRVEAFWDISDLYIVVRGIGSFMRET